MSENSTEAAGGFSTDDSWSVESTKYVASMVLFVGNVVITLDEWPPVSYVGLAVLVAAILGVGYVMRRRGS